jgi:hypothetical protein
MLGAIVLTAFAGIYALVIRKVLADSRAADMEKAQASAELRKSGIQDHYLSDKAIETAEAHRHYVEVGALEVDEASQAQYAMGVKTVKQSLTSIAGYRDQIRIELQPYTTGENPRIAYVGSRNRKYKLIDDSGLSREDKIAVDNFIRDYNASLAIGPGRSLMERLRAIKPVTAEGRDAELAQKRPPDEAPPQIDLEELEKKALEAITPPRSVMSTLKFWQKSEKTRFGDTEVYRGMNALAERAVKSSGEGRGRGA